MNTSELASSIGSIVSKLHKGMRKRSDSVKDYSMTEVETIMHLFRSSPLLPTELAALTKITTQSMSQILKDLEEQGIIKRIPSKDDKRKVHIYLTSQGKNMVDKVKEDTNKWLKETIETTLTDKEKGILVKVLPVLNKLI